MPTIVSTAPCSTRSTRTKKSSRTLSRSRTTTTRSRSSSRTASSKGRYVTIYLSHTLAARYEDQAALFKTTVGKLIKEQVEAKPLSFYDKMKKFIGSAGGLPKDLSTNPAYLEDFGKDSLPHTKPPITKNKK